MRTTYTALSALTMAVYFSGQAVSAQRTTNAPKPVTSNASLAGNSVQPQRHAKSAQASTSHDVSGTFSLDQPAVVSGEPVQITYRVTNNALLPIRFAEARGRGSVQRSEYEFTATDTKGVLVSPLEGGMIISGFIQSVTVAPGETSLLHLDLSDWFQMKNPGSYTIHCTRTLGVIFMSPGKEVSQKPLTVVTSMNLILKVLPPLKIGRV